MTSILCNYIGLELILKKHHHSFNKIPHHDWQRSWFDHGCNHSMHSFYITKPLLAYHHILVLSSQMSKNILILKPHYIYWNLLTFCPTICTYFSFYPNTILIFHNIEGIVCCVTAQNGTNKYLKTMDVNCRLSILLFLFIILL